jgi:EpsI family protein
MNALRRNQILMVLMIAASVLALALVPAHRIADDGKKFDLESMIPKKFGGWTELPEQRHQIINPELQQSMERIYSQTLLRTYYNQAGEQIMLSIAYGADQSDVKSLHYPEVCYPAQGFQVLSREPGEIKTEYGNIRVKRVLTMKGNRTEPLTYWSTVGNVVVRGNKETKLEQLRYGLHGDIPDGLLFRVSSIKQDAEAGYAIQQDFVRELLASIPEADRLRLAGLPAAR